LPEIERLAGDEPAAAAWRGILPLAYLDAGDPTRAQAAYERALGGGLATLPRTMLWLTAMGSLTVTGNAGSVHRLLGRAAATAGWEDRAHAHFEAALRRHTELGAAPLLARTRCDYAEFLLHGTRAQLPIARRYLREARLAARRLGMVGVATRADND
jgi:hypothetical protein